MVRFVKDNHMYERFLTFMELTIRTGAELAAKIVVDTLRGCYIGITQVRCLGYDGCSTRSDQFTCVHVEENKTCLLSLHLSSSCHVFNIAVHRPT